MQCKTRQYECYFAPYAPVNAKADDDEGYNGGICVRAKRSKVNRMLEGRHNREIEMLLSARRGGMLLEPSFQYAQGYTDCSRPRHLMVISDHLRYSSRRHRPGQYSPAPP